MTSKIIVTGGLGFLGQHIVKEVVSSYPNKKVLVLARSERKLWVFKKTPPNLEIKTNTHIDKPSTYEHLIGRGDIIIHNAGLVSYKKSDKEKIYKSNVFATIKILQICTFKNIKKFIMISSISAVGLKNDMGREEFFPDANRISHEYYSHSKLMAELEVNKYKNILDYLILNPSVIIGPGAPYLKSLIKILSHTPVAFSISATNSYVDARDVARATVLAINSTLKHERFILTSHNVNTHKVIEKLHKLLSGKGKIVAVPDSLINAASVLANLSEELGVYPFSKKPKSLLQNKSYSSDKAQKMLGWTPKYTLNKSLSDTIKWANYESGK